MLISVHAADGKDVAKAKEIFEREGTTGISYSGEAAVKAALEQR